jgi:hypothetical protein
MNILISSKVNALAALHLSRRSLLGCSAGRLRSPVLRFGDGSQSAGAGSGCACSLKQKVET